MPSPETNLQRRIVKMLRARGWYAQKVHSSRYAQAGWPDLLAIRDGRCLFIEVKMPGREPTALQEAMHDRLRSAGAQVEVAWSVEDAQRAAAYCEEEW